MPAIITADSNVTLEPPVTLAHFQSQSQSQSYPGLLLSPYSIYITVVALAFFVVLRVAFPFSLAKTTKPSTTTTTSAGSLSAAASGATKEKASSTTGPSVSAPRECRKDYNRPVLARPSGSASGVGVGFGVGVAGGSSAPSSLTWTWNSSFKPKPKTKTEPKNRPNPEEAEGVWWAQRQAVARAGGGGVIAGIVGGPGQQGQALHNQEHQQAIRLTGTGLSDSTRSSRTGRSTSSTSSTSRDMDMDMEHQSRSRGVSSRNINAADLRSQRLSSSPAPAGRNARRSPSSPSSSSSPSRTSSDGAASGPREKGTMDDGDIRTSHMSYAMNEEQQPQHLMAFDITTAAAAVIGGPAGGAAAAAAPGRGFDFTTPRQFMARPPPPPPLTPPTLSSAIFTIDDRRRSYPHSIPAKMDAVSPASFIHQPNPDYVGSSSSANVRTDAPPTTPRRRSYNKTLPIGIPVSQHSPSSSSPTELPSATTDGFSPSSFPPTSPLLPPPPPGHHELAVDVVDGHHSIGREIDVQGEIISVLDDSGAGWKRHTRVYGGGVCLACVAAGGGGGFYGDTVRPEDRR